MTLFRAHTLTLLLLGAGFMNLNTLHAQFKGVQGIVGATSIDEDEIVFNGVEGLDPNDASSELPTLWTVGVASQQAAWGNPETTLAGFEGGLLMSFGSDNRNVTAGNGTAIITVDESIVLGDLFFGLFLSQRLGGARFYTGIGPVVMYGRVTGDFNERGLDNSQQIIREETESSWGMGGYARAGLEFDWATGGTFGIGVRGFYASLQFDQTLGDVDFQGVQGLVSYTQGF